MPKRNLIWIGAILAAAVVTVYVTRTVPPRDPSSDSNLKALSSAYQTINENYYLPVDDDLLRQGAINGMVEMLDEFSRYIPPGKAVALDLRLKGVERGLGLRVQVAEGDVTVLGPLPASPAHRGGVRAGDRILAIDGKKVEGLTQDVVEQMLDGKAGMTVELELQHRDGAKEVLALKPGDYPFETVEGLCRAASGEWTYLVDDDEGIGYFRIKEFVEKNTLESFQNTVRELADLRAVVLDLRDNPGGSLRPAVEVADLFLDSGVIVTAVYRGARRDVYKAHVEGTLPRFPVVVLVNARTASAAEIVAGSLRQHDRAVLVGTRTWGKGCLQNVFPLPENMGKVSLTTAQWFLGDGETVSRKPGSDRWGVDPHEEVLLSPQAQARLQKLKLVAEVLPSPATAPATGPARAAIVQEILTTDTQLRRALQILKTPKAYDRILQQAAAERVRKHSATSQAATGHDE
jgi:carboxyl-terminal processing protease